MKKQFPGYYRPSPEDQSENFKKCVFCFDTNALLNLYRYTPESRQNLIQVLTDLSDRIWIPHQVAYEYQRNRISVLLDEHGLCDSINGIIDDAIKSINNIRRTKQFTVTSLTDPVKVELECIKCKLKEKKEDKPDLMTGDTVFNEITKLFDGKVGPAYSTDKYNELYKIGKDRYESHTPPGFMDKSNNPKDINQFGDFILWHQLIEYAKSHNQPIILVTDDAKVDWWNEVRGEKLGPRPELIQEFIEKTDGSKSFYMYSTEQFLKFAKTYLGAGVTQQTIKEAEVIEKQDSADEKSRMAEAGITSAQEDLIINEIASNETLKNNFGLIYPWLSTQEQYEEARKRLGADFDAYAEARRILARRQSNSYIDIINAVRNPSILSVIHRYNQIKKLAGISEEQKDEHDSKPNDVQSSAACENNDTESVTEEETLETDLSREDN